MIKKSMSSITPKIEIRAQTPEEEFVWLEQMLSELPWYKENGYTLGMPDNPTLQQPFSPQERESKLKEFLEHEYNPAFFAKGLEILESHRPLFEQTLPVFQRLNTAWGFKVFPIYQFTLTKYGPGGNYHPDEGRIVMLTRSDGSFKRVSQTHTPIHEMVHMGIEDNIVNHFWLSHWEKERIVDLMTQLLFADLLPDYMLQDKGDKRVDPFVTAETLQNLPASIEKYVGEFPRI